jgi:hypothetical protein
MKTHQVPFTTNPNNRCLPATIGMALGYFMPERQFTMSELEKICGYEDDHATWPITSMLELHKLGFQLHWIADFNFKQFVDNPKTYLRSILDDEAFEWQVTHGDLEQEASRMKQYLASDLPIEQRKGTKHDIEKFLDDGWLVRLEVNGLPLSGKTGYDGHSILVIGYNDKEAIIHNPDGVNGNKPNQHVSWELLDKAWREFGGSYSLYAFKKDVVT